MAMKSVFILLSATVCVLAIPQQIDDEVYLKKQKDIFRLFNHVNQPSYYQDFIQIAEAFKFEGNWDQWTKPDFAKEFHHYYEHDILPQGEIFSVFYQDHLNQAIALFRTLYYAKDYETFYKIAVWARQHVNAGMFVYALAVATVHSPHTSKVILPSIYEINPHYFFGDEVLYKAQQYKLQYRGDHKHETDEVEDEIKIYQGYTINANYSGWYLNVHPEQSMSYFTEDVGINAYYYYRHIFTPFWLSDKEIFYDATHRGEFFFWRHQQLMARYYLERLSNGLGEIPHFEYDYPIETGYCPSLTYTNGLHFPTRPNHADLYYHNIHGEQSNKGHYNISYTKVKDYERRLRDALDIGHIYTEEGKVVSLFDKNGLETLGRLVECNADSPNGRYYGDLLNFASNLLGYSCRPLDKYKVAPSALEHFETSMRDPMFYQMYKRTMTFLYQHQQHAGPYKHNELHFHGVEIQDVEVEDPITYFEEFYCDLSNAVYVHEKEFNEDTFQVRAHQHRLTHMPFSYKINVDSQKATEAFVKIFIGPKYDEYGRVIDIDRNRQNFYEIDRFHHKLNAGKNVIERSSYESDYFAVDRPTIKQNYEEIRISLQMRQNVADFNSSTNHHFDHYGFPMRYMLPKGAVGGKTYQFYVILAPYHAPTKDDMTSRFNVDSEYSMGYPFDKTIVHEHDFRVANSFFKDLVIHHNNK